MHSDRISASTVRRIASPRVHPEVSDSSFMGVHRPKGRIAPRSHHFLTCSQNARGLPADFCTATDLFCIRGFTLHYCHRRQVFVHSRHFAFEMQFALMITAASQASTENDHLVEIGEILAAGLIRAVARKSSPNSADTGESLLHILPDQSGHPTPQDRRTSDG
jgi:hypothetical protein